MKIKLDGPARRPLPDARVVPAAPPPPSGTLGLPWSLAARPGSLRSSVVSHLGMATLTAVLLALVPSFSGPPAAAIHYGLELGKSPADGHAPPAPSEMSVDLRGGSPTPGERPELRTFAPNDHLGVVVRHNGRRSDQARLLVSAKPLTGRAASAPTGPEIFIGLDPQRVAWDGRALHYEGTVEEILPLGRGLWRLTFMISDPRECEPRALHVCARVDAWLNVQ